MCTFLFSLCQVAHCRSDSCLGHGSDHAQVVFARRVSPRSVFGERTAATARRSWGNGRRLQVMMWRLAGWANRQALGAGGVDSQGKFVHGGILVIRGSLPQKSSVLFPRKNNPWPTSAACLHVHDDTLHRRPVSSSLLSTPVLAVTVA